MRNTSIGQQINHLLVTTIITGMTSLALALAVYQFNSTVNARRAGLEATGYVFASAIGESIAARNTQDIQRVLHATNHLHDVVGVFALDAQEHVLANAGNPVVLSSNIMAGEPTLLKMLQQGLMPVSVEVVRGGANVGRLVLIGDITNVRRQLLNTLWVTLISGALALALALIMANRLQRRITRPIVQLTKSISALRKAHMYVPTEIPNAEGETRILVESFNGMIGEIHDRDAALKKLAYFDALTGLPNRSSFQQCINDYFETHGEAASSCTILLLDIDNFKAINDTLGQVIGDALLLNVAALLRDAQPEGALVARLDGDEFGVFVPDTKTVGEAQVAVAPFIACLYQPMRIFAHELSVTACGGIAFAPDFGPTSEALQRNARLALSQAKSDGAGHVVSYRHEIGEGVDEEMMLERGLRGAIAAGELELHYQPIVSSIAYRVEGFEALLRWRRADGKMIPPVKFIPLAEKTGLITELGKWVLEKACRDAQAWREAGEPERFVSVNVSPSQIFLSDFVTTVEDALMSADLPAELLCLELTESLFIGKSMSLVKNMLIDLKRLGVITALDDFGTGYSSLAYLEHLPFDKLKIDRAFVHKPIGVDQNKPLLQGIAQLAHALGISIVAEGAETFGEVALLREIGVQSIQGYYFAKPMPAAEALVAATQIESQKAPMVGPPGLEPGTRRL